MVTKKVKEAAPVKRTRKTAVADVEVKKPKLDIASLYNESLNVIAKRQGFESSGLDVAPPMSMGLLEIDMIMGGGIRACMLTGAGNEQCAKTTLALTTMGAAIKANIPIIGFCDFEGSTRNSKPYVHSILKGMGIKLSMDEVFGKTNKDGTVVPGKVRYRAETILERFYDWLSEILRELPDKRYVEGKWWLVFDEKNKRHKAKVADFVDSAMTRKYGNGLWVEAPDDKIQGIIFVDSYTAMQPEAKDGEDISNQLSVKASAFSKQLERVKGRMAQKMVTVYGLNHLRSNPMAMFGPKESEKGGAALQQFSDVRLRQTSRSLSAAPFSPKADKKLGYDESEPTVEFETGKDRYRYVHVKAIKNKLWTPQRECFIRVWVEDGSGTARGLDPVFDTIAFLKNTGQLTGTRANFKLNLAGLGPAKNGISWMQLKKWILGSKEVMSKASAHCGYKPMDLRAFCFKQVQNGTAEELYVKVQSAKAADKGGDDDGDSSED
jgi:recA bacterial DNA recombination protein